MDWDSCAATSIGERLLIDCRDLQRLADETVRCANTLNYSARIYESAEARLLADADFAEKDAAATPGQQDGKASHSEAPGYAWYLGGSFLSALYPPMAIPATLMQLYGVFGGGERSWGDSRNGGSVDYWGMDDSGVLYGARSGVYGQSGASSGSATAYLGKVDATWNPFEVNLTEGVVGTDVGLAVSAFSADARGDIGGDDLGVYAEGEVDALTAEVGLQAGAITTDEGETVVGVQGKAIAALGTGGVETGFKIAGIEIGLTADGYVGAVGVEGEAVVGSEGAAFKLGAADVIGGAIGISVDWSEAALPGWVPGWLH